MSLMSDLGVRIKNGFDEYINKPLITPSVDLTKGDKVQITLDGSEKITSSSLVDIILENEYNANPTAQVVGLNVEIVFDPNNGNRFIVIFYTSQYLRFRLGNISGNVITFSNTVGAFYTESTNNITKVEAKISPLNSNKFTVLYLDTSRRLYIGMMNLTETEFVDSGSYVTYDDTVVDASFDYNPLVEDHILISKLNYRPLLYPNYDDSIQLISMTLNFDDYTYNNISIKEKYDYLLTTGYTYIRFFTETKYIMFYQLSTNIFCNMSEINNSTFIPEDIIITANIDGFEGLMCNVQQDPFNKMKGFIHCNVSNTEHNVRFFEINDDFSSLSFSDANYLTHSKNPSTSALSRYYALKYSPNRRNYLLFSGIDNNIDGTIETYFIDNGSIIKDISHTLDYSSHESSASLTSYFIPNNGNKILTVSNYYSVSTSTYYFTAFVGQLGSTNYNGVLSFVDDDCLSSKSQFVSTHGSLCKSLSGLTAGKRYYMNSFGELTTEWTNEFVGIAVSPTSMLLSNV